MQRFPGPAANTSLPGSIACPVSCLPPFNSFNCRARQGTLFRGCKLEAVQIARCLERDQLIGKIGLDHRAGPRPGIADAAAAGRQDEHPLAGRGEMLTLAGQAPAGPQADDTRRAESPTADAPRGLLDTFIGGVVAKGLLDA